MSILAATREALVAELLRARLALETGGLGVWDIDLSTGACHWSEAFESHYGSAPGILVGSRDAWTEQVHPDDRASFHTVFDHAVKTGADFSTRHRTLDGSGTTHWLQVDGRVFLDGQGSPARAVGVSRDITEQCALEEQLRQGQATASTGQPFRAVAHDLNNALVVILGEAELSASDLPPGSPLGESLEAILKAGRRAADLTRRLLD